MIINFFKERFNILTRHWWEALINSKTGYCINPCALSIQYTKLSET